VAELETIYSYMRLCVETHKLIYVKMLFMLSCCTEDLFRWNCQM
jgi:hypothetical protein